jgi:uncharacterized membrane protein
MNKEELLNIRKQIMDASLPLLLESNAAPEDRFDILLRFIRLNSATKTSALYKSAYDTALSFEDSSARLDALMRLLGEVDTQLDNSSAAELATAEPVVAEAPASQDLEATAPQSPPAQSEESAPVVENNEPQPAPSHHQHEHVDN